MSRAPIPGVERVLFTEEQIEQRIRVLRRFWLGMGQIVGVPVSGRVPRDDTIRVRPARELRLPRKRARPDAVQQDDRLA